MLKTPRNLTFSCRAPSNEANKTNRLLHDSIYNPHLVLWGVCGKKRIQYFNTHSELQGTKQSKASFNLSHF